MWSEKAVSRKGGGGSLQESLSCTCFIFCFPVGFYLGIVSFDCFLTEPQTSSVRQGRLWEPPRRRARPLLT